MLRNIEIEKQVFKYLCERSLIFGKDAEKTGKPEEKIQSKPIGFGVLAREGKKQFGWQK